MLTLLGVSLLGAAYLVFVFTVFVCRQRPASLWASEAMVLVVLTPAIMALFVAGAACLAKAWVDGALRHLDSVDAVIGLAGILLVVLAGYLFGTRSRKSRTSAT